LRWRRKQHIEGKLRISKGRVIQVLCKFVQACRERRLVFYCIGLHMLQWKRTVCFSVKLQCMLLHVCECHHTGSKVRSVERRWRMISTLAAAAPRSASPRPRLHLLRLIVQHAARQVKRTANRCTHLTVEDQQQIRNILTRKTAEL